MNVTSTGVFKYQFQYAPFNALLMFLDVTELADTALERVLLVFIGEAFGDSNSLLMDCLFVFSIELR